MTSGLSEHARRRLEELRRELMIGEGRLQELERETASVRQTMLRISGAIQVLAELLDHAEEATPSNVSGLEDASTTSVST